MYRLIHLMASFLQIYTEIILKITYFQVKWTPFWKIKMVNINELWAA